MRLSARASSVSESRTLGLWTELARLRAAGEDVVGLLEGEADLPPPPEVVSAVARAVRSGATRYSHSAGLPELRAAIARALQREGVPARPDGVLVTNGAKQAVYELLQTLCAPGDEVLIPTPCWTTFPAAARLAGAKPVLVPAAPDHQLDVDALGRAAGARTRGLILNTPNNPTGAVYSREALRAVLRLARRKSLFVISDEAYEALVFDGAEHVSCASLAPRDVLTVRTFSKTYSMTGFRVGYAAGDPRVLAAATRLHSHLTGNVCTFAQHGALAALELGSAYRAKRRAIFERRRDLAFAEASRLFGCVKPAGGFFVFPDARRYLGRRFRDSEALARHLLRAARVAVVPGSACGLEGHLRVSFSFSEAAIREGFARMRRVLTP
ncbi:MAG TPA: pyridoxal phosphate-dependent aminotransferase [Elusimicrobiota bacterium]|jgi:aspartate aminotransferase|nr:pyridoxal phosphate-dependent aminotransferase [Elusimicrobiota bacterium]